jgi:glyoxylate reductase
VSNSPEAIFKLLLCKQPKAKMLEKGIRVANTPGAVDDATADTAIFIMLGALRLANISMNILRQGKWGKTELPVAHDPRGKTLGILGMGGIGRNLAAKARAFGMRVQYHNRSRLAPELEDGATYVDFKTLLATSDVFSLNLALNKSTEHIIGREELAQMKKGVTIINTARGKLIDEAALADALSDGDRIWSVGLDVFEDEPAVHPGLLSNERAFLVPHIGTLTYETRVSALGVLHSRRARDQKLTICTESYGAGRAGQHQEWAGRGQVAHACGRAEAPAMTLEAVHIEI